MKTLKGSTRMYLYAGVSKPNTKLGQALGPLGMNMNQFCKEFNEKTAFFRPDVPLRVSLKAYTDRTYEFVIKPPPTSWYLKRVTETFRGSDYAKHEHVTGINIKYIYEIAKIKKEFDPDFKNASLIGIVKCIIGQAQSMGLYVDNEINMYFQPSTPKKI